MEVNYTLVMGVSQPLARFRVVQIGHSQEKEGDSRD